MSRSEDKETTRRHVIIYQEDYEFIMSMWGEHPGFSYAVRNIIHKYIKNMREKALAKAGAKPVSISEEIFDGEA